MSIKKTLALLFVLIALCAACAENMVYNPAFDIDEASVSPSGWYTTCWNNDNTQFGVDETDGEKSLYIFSFDYNDARWVQDIEVKPNTDYHLSCLVKVSGCSPDGRGANISIMNTGAYSESVYDTAGEWVRLDLYGTTEKRQDTLQIALRIGGYSGDCTGEAWFKDVTVEEAGAPSEAVSYSFATYEPFSDTDSEKETGLPERKSETYTLYTFIFALAGFAAIAHAKRGDARLEVKTHTRDVLLLVLSLTAALAVRVFIAFKVYGYAVDIGCFTYWSEAMAENGFKFYAKGYFCDYPPVYMLLLGAVSLLRQLFGIAYGTSAHAALIKLIPILADLATALTFYKLFSKKAGSRKALLLSVCVAFNPAYIIDSAAWGQVDSLLAFIMLLLVIFACNKKWHIALPLYALAVLTKPQALVFGPIGLTAVVVSVVLDKKQLKSALIGAAAAFGLIYIICAPFAFNVRIWQGRTDLLTLIASPYSWIWGQLFDAASGYRYITINACNLYTLLKLNWVSISECAGTVKLIAWLLFGASYVYSAYLIVKAGDVKALPLAACALMCGVFAFAPMMHERYLFPALVLSLFAYINYGDRRLLKHFVLMSAAEFINIYLVLVWGMTAGYENYGHLQSDEQLINALVSLLNVFSALYIFVISADIICFKHIKPLKKAEGAESLTKPDYKLCLNRIDALLLAGVTLIYSAFAFVNLGTSSSPENGWKSMNYGEQVVFDLGEVKTYRMTYFGGVSGTKFTVALSNDGEHWTEENYAEYEEGMMYSWVWYVPKIYEGGAFSNAYSAAQGEADTGETGAYVTYCSYNDEHPLQTSRYLRITVNGINLVLNEVAFIDTENECLFEIKDVYGSEANGDYSALTDEQNKVSLIPSYYNGMYFDEIYHARTAYELLHGYRADEILEWSHPHLGKLIIAAGIKLFGMTPFGWRFSGTVFGALMLPVMYLLIKQLTGKSTLSFAGMILLALDSMHFTQTRIATVDTYAVFFIMVMYLFMIRYYLMSRNGVKLLRRLIPLGLSGLFMGFACAAKWTGIYASAGLAVIFFISLIGEIIDSIKAGGEQRKGLWNRVIITCGFCVLVFIIVPVLIYYFSYYWHFATSGGLSVEKVWELQQSMYNYHASLIDNHYFKSPWYEWPLIVKPMWYYSADTAYVGRGVVSSISCMGNPAVWWTGLAGMITLLIMWTVSRKKEHAMRLTAIGFASQFLPWVLVPRSTFIYHYFASVPFIIISTVMVGERIFGKNKKLLRTLVFILIGAAFILFVMFYPLESGYPCPYWYAKLLRWFNWYNFALQ